MKIQLWSVGKNHEPHVLTGVEDFTRRISKYFPVQWTIIAPVKHAAQMAEKELKKKEGETILAMLQKEDYLVALDERGKQFHSEELSRFLEARAGESTKNLIFLIGGAYGIDDPVLLRANFRWSLSALTFPHQLVRLILAEQVYRACTIIRHEKYHHS